MSRKIAKKWWNNPRYQAVVALERIEKGSYSNLLINDILNKVAFSPEDRHLFTELVYGTLMHRLTLEYQLEPFLKDKKKIQRWVYLLLQSALFQFLYLDKIPDHAILNESVEIAKVKGHQGIGNLVNGVLRSFQRQGKRSTKDIQDPKERLSIEASFPKKWIDFLSPQIGFDKVKALAFSLLQPSHVSARITSPSLTQKEASDILKQEGIKTTPSAIFPKGIVGEKGYLAGSTLFKAGALTIQDESSMLVAPSMMLQKEDKVLDACAAPGGKTTHIASYLDKGSVVALDLHPHKVKLIRENAKRLHLEEKINAQVLDARLVDETFEKESFDAILVDAPCSGLGLMRRKPDIKYQKHPDEFETLPQIQYDILHHVAPVLKKGGTLLYSTCTINQKENEEVISRFLKDHQAFHLEEVPTENKLALKQKMLTIYPQDYITDGFFIARMKKDA